jgi:hypothetical protein
VFAELELIPTHVGHGQILCIRKLPHASRQQPEAFHIAFLRRFEQQLHADADAENGLLERANRIHQPNALQPAHAVSRRTHAWQQHMAGRSHDRGIRGQLGFDAQTFHGVTQRCDVGAATIDDGQPRAHSVPFVLGSSVSVIRKAWRSVRPTPLKQASIM